MSLAAYEDHGAKTEQFPAEDAPDALWPWLFGEPVELTPANDGGPALPEFAKRALRLDPKLFSRALALADWLVLALAAEFAARWGSGLSLTEMSFAAAAPIVLAVFSIKAGLWAVHVYDAPASSAGPQQGQGGLALGAMAGLVFSGFFAADPRTAAATAAVLPLTAVLLALVHAAFGFWTRFAFTHDQFAERVVLIGDETIAARFIARARAERRFDVIATLADADAERLAVWDRLPEVDRIVLCVSPAEGERISALTDALDAAPNRVELLLEQDVIAARGRHVNASSGMGFVTLSAGVHARACSVPKRALDIIGSLALLTLLAPALLTITAILRASGHALTWERKRGLNNRIIAVPQFRTDGGPFGAMLKRSAVHETPHLISVLKGDLSLVGPRAHAPEIGAGVAHYAHRHRVKPGLIGWAQVKATRGKKAKRTLLDTLRHDLDYIGRANLWFDLWIVIRAVPSLLRR